MGVVDIQGKLRLALGAVKDHASIGKTMICKHEEKRFTDIDIAVVRATGHDNGSIDDKHMHEILFLVSGSGPSGSIPFLANRISRRLGKTRDPLVALKTLLLIHRLLRGGNHYFEQQLRCMYISGHLQIKTRWFLTDSSLSFLHRYAAYLEERIEWVINQSGKLEPVNVIQFRSYDEKSIDMIFRKLPKCQDFIDKVLDCWPISDNNILSFSAMSNTLKESFQVYLTYSDGVAALVSMFFDLTRPARALACQILKRASHQSQDLQYLYENCKRVIQNKNLAYPLVQIISTDHVMALEQCSRTFDVDCVTNKETELTAKQGETNFNLSSALLSCTLETKISKVWVLFEEDEDRSS